MCPRLVNSTMPLPYRPAAAATVSACSAVSVAARGLTRTKQAVAGLHRRHQRRAPALDRRGGHAVSRRRKAAVEFRRGRHRSRSRASLNRSIIAPRAAGLFLQDLSTSPSPASHRRSRRTGGRACPAASRRRQTPLDGARDLRPAAIAVAHHPRDPCRVGCPTPDDPGDFLGQRARSRFLRPGGIDVIHRRFVAQAVRCRHESPLMRGEIGRIEQVDLAMVLGMDERVRAADPVREPLRVGPAFEPLTVSAGRCRQVAVAQIGSGRPCTGFDQRGHAGAIGAGAAP